MEVEVAEPGLANAHRIGQHGLEHRLKLAWRTRNDAQHLGGRCLLLQRLAEVVGTPTQLVEQPRVLDGDDRLLGEIADQLDMLIGERTNLLAVDADLADELVLLEHRHSKQGARAGLFDDREPFWVRPVSWLQPDVSNLTSSFCCQNATHRRPWIWAQHRFALPRLRICRRRSMQRDGPESIALAQPQDTELGLAEARCLRQYGFKDGLQVSG